MSANKEKLLVQLANLQERLASPSNPSEMFAWFISNSSSGENCKFAKKALQLFFLRDFPEISTLIAEIASTIEKISHE